MTSQTNPTPPAVMARPFPVVGPLMRLAFRELHIAATGTKEQLKKLGDPTLLPRPWDPPSCRQPELRAEMWTWLEDVVVWINSEYVWDVAQMIPSCWPAHPHLVHEIATVADQRRRAGAAPNSDPLEEWHRYCLPAFMDRMRGRVRDHCEEGHQTWPARGRHARYTSPPETAGRRRTVRSDLQASIGTAAAHSGTRVPRLTVVDLDTGEITDDCPRR